MLIPSLIIATLIVIYYLRKKTKTVSVDKLCNRAIYFTSRGQDAMAIHEIDKMIALKVTPQEEHVVATAMLLKIDCLARLAAANLTTKDDLVIPSYPTLVQSEYFHDLGPLGPSSEAIASCDDVINRFIGHTDKDLKRTVLMAILCKGAHLTILGEPMDRIANIDVMIKYFDDDDEPFVINYVLEGMLRKGNEFNELQEADNAIAVYDNIEQKFNRYNQYQLEDITTLITAMVNKNKLLNKLDHIDEALTNFNNLITRYEDFPDVDIKPILIPYADVLAKSGRCKDAIAYYNIMIEHFAESSESQTIKEITRAYTGKAIILEHMEQNNLAIDIYDRLIDDFSSIDDHDITYELIPMAYVGKAILLQRKGEKYEANAILEALMYYNKNNIYTGLNYIVKGYQHRTKLLFDMGRLSEAKVTCDLIVNLIQDIAKESDNTEEMIAEIQQDKEKIADAVQ